MKNLTVPQIIRMHELLIEQTGGTFGVRDNRLLESALYSPFQTFGGKELYPTILDKVSRITFGIISNHPFIDGNKRIGILVMLTTLELNDIQLNCIDEELIHLGLKLAAGEMNHEDLLLWIKIRL